MPVWRFPFFLLLMNLALVPVSAQYLFDNLNTKDGLASREVRCVYRDQEGFVWMGTIHGINRFDGSHFRLWNKSSPTYPQSIGQMVNCFAEYGKNQIWFGTENGAGIFDKTTFSFRAVIFRLPAGRSGEKIHVNYFLKDRSGKFWVSTKNGLFVEKDGELVPVSTVYPFAREADNQDFYYRCFLYDSIRNTIWAASGKGLCAIDLDKHQVYSSSNNPDSLPFFKNQYIISITFDHKGDLWWGETNALCHFDFNTRRHQRITQINDNPAWRLGGGANCLFMDKTGRLWISTWLYTSFIRRPDGVFEQIPYDQDLPHSISYGFFVDAMEDQYGNIWLATINGISRYVPGHFVSNIIKAPSYDFFLPTGFANINTIMPGKGSLWLGKMEGLVRYDSLSGKFDFYRPFPGPSPWNEVHDIDTIGNEIWCASGNGIQIFDPATKKFRSFPYYPTIKGQVRKAVSWIYRDSKGFIWSSVWNDAVYRFDPGTKKCIRFDGSEPQYGDMSSGYSVAFFETVQQKIWMTAWGKGIRIFDMKTNKFHVPPDTILRKDVFYSIAGDKNGNIWVSSEHNAIFKCNPDGRVIDSITSRNGLMEIGISDLCFDAHDRLWAISRERFLCIEPNTRLVIPVTAEITYSFNDHWNHLIRVGDKLYGAMLDRVVILDPRKFQQLPKNLSPLISGFKVFQADRAFSKETPVKLDYRQNFFSIDFSSPFHREYSSIQYAYMLEGFDKDWVYTGRNQTAEYTNVPAGNYTFHVKSTDGSNEWMENATVLSIHIEPPFWKTWWFKLLILVLIVVLGRGLWVRRKRSKQQRQVELTIDYFANSVYGENSVNEICWDIARNCISQLQFEDCVVYLLDNKRNVLVQKAAYGPKNPKGHEIENPMEIELGKGIVGAVAESGKPLLINDTRLDQRYIVDDEQRFSELAVPILHDNKVIGVIDSENSKKNFFTPGHLKAMMTIASISANKIAEAQAESLARVNEIKLLEINKMLAESQLMALRAQMNPHFVFNCLNSIQECIVTQKYGEASNYLNKFSKLFRMVLNNSGKNLVSIDEEKEVLKLYLELELMRFEKSFQYTIEADEKLETDEILMPSMILQPYVENALWHGLMHKEGERYLLIRFEKISDEVFRCTINDNGIGRKKSFELKEQQSKTKHHESKGLKISKDRLDVLQKQGFHASLEIIDKYDGTGQAAGTTVIIELSTFLTA